MPELDFEYLGISDGNPSIAAPGHKKRGTSQPPHIFPHPVPLVNHLDNPYQGLTMNQVIYRYKTGQLPKAYDTGQCQMRGCKQDAQVYDHCHTHGYVRGAICIDCNLAISDFDTALNHNSFVYCTDQQRLWFDLNARSALRHWLKCPQCASLTVEDYKDIRRTCKAVAEWQHFMTADGRPYRKLFVAGKHDIEVTSCAETLERRYLAYYVGHRKHPAVRCPSCCDGCPVRRWAKAAYSQRRTQHGVVATDREFASRLHVSKPWPEKNWTTAALQASRAL